MTKNLDQFKKFNVDFKTIYNFVKNNYLKNRTIVTKDIKTIFESLETNFKIKIKKHYYKSGQEFGTWIIPKSWNIKKAFLKDSKKNIIASYDENPLFVAPYSASINKSLKKKELKKNIYISEKQSDAFSYNHRIAFDPHKSNKEWCISIPKKRWDRMSENDFFNVVIETDVFNDEMIIGEITVKGKSNKTIALLADFCHPGQVNDSFSGLVMFMNLIKFLKEQKMKLKYTYSLIILPETIGSAVYLASKSQKNKKIIGAIFSDDICKGDSWYIKKTRMANTYMDMLAKQCTKKFSDINLANFFEVIGNDEHIFDSPQVNIPSLSIQKFPFDEYHTSNDNLDILNKENLQRASEITLEMIRLLESDDTFKFKHNVPFHMSRFNLYADFTNDHENYLINRNIMNHINGIRSSLEIADKLDITFDRVNSFVESMNKAKLLKKVLNEKKIIF